jgi:ferredoxin-type protein NapG
MIFTRRTFTKIIALGLIMPKTAMGFDKPVQALRPPGALPEYDFLERCNRCQKCVQVCPTKVIVPLSLSEGVIRLNTPKVSFKQSYCNSCLKCSQVCPTGALVPVTKETLDIGVAVIIEKDCVAWDWVGCTVCKDECPEKAIYLDDDKRPVVIPEKCNGCGICELKCPSTSVMKKASGKGVLVKQRGENTPPRIPNWQERG